MVADVRTSNKIKIRLGYEEGDSELWNRLSAKAVFSHATMAYTGVDSIAAGEVHTLDPYHSLSE